MTSTEVRQLVERAIAGEWNRSNLHHVDLRKALIEPAKRTFATVRGDDEVDAWLILLEDPRSELGYGVVYDEGSRQYGLVQFAAGYTPTLLGLYDGFFEALEAM
jgi:hypothetical protein